MTNDDFTALTQEIGTAFLDEAPSGWVAGELLYQEVGSTAELDATARLADGTVQPLAISYTAMDAFNRMRALMAQPGKGAWFTATCRIEAPSRITFDYDYDHEPTWESPTSVGHYLEEWEAYPRDAEHTPAWLTERLAEAREWADSGR
jgi:hypothetical protein